VEEANGGRDLESPALGSELQPCQMVVVVEEVPEDRPTQDMLMEDRAIVGCMTPEERGQEDNWTVVVAAEDSLTRDVSTRDAMRLIGAAVSDAL
jgi:hypothetical protein